MGKGSMENTDLEEERCIVFNEFKHFDDVVQLLDSMKESLGSLRNEEAHEEKFKIIFNFYQEQPHLMDSCLPDLLERCLTIIRENLNDDKVFHFAFRVIYYLIKTRGYKSIVKLMPHSVEDIEPTLKLLSDQDAKDRERWQTRYVLLLWLSILIMVPFGLSRLDLDSEAPLIDRIFYQAKRHIDCDERTQEAAAFLLARLITRPDVVVTHLLDSIEWACDELKSSSTIRVCGVLRFLSNLCRLGRRAELLPSLPKMLSSLDHSSVDATTRTNLPCHLRTKLVQRIGLLLCPIQPQLSIQRRQSALQSSSILTSKPSKKLADNLAATPASSIKASFQAECDEPHACISVANISSSSVLHPGDNRSNIRAKAPEDLSKGDADSRLMADGQALVEMGLEIEVIPDQVAEVIDFLIDQMRSQYTVVRWSAAKGLGRICARLPPTMCYDVLSAVLSLCTRFEPHTAWHGACLTLAELGRRGLLPPDQLAGVLPVLQRSLFYDEKSGEHNYGTNVRDSACYVAWAFARAFHRSDLAPYVSSVSSSLLLVALFDREVNVRRAAAAAFQENVGRQGQFPHGIDIVTTCDYFAVGNLQNCYLKLSVFVAGFPEYTSAICDHLAFVCLGHWDSNIRVLAAKALFNLTPLQPESMQNIILPRIIQSTTGRELNMRQGSIFGVAELVHALGKERLDKLSDCMISIKEVVPKLLASKQFRGLTGELMCKACCHLISMVSVAGLKFHEDEILEIWRSFLDDCISHKEETVQDAAVAAYPNFLATYLFGKNGNFRSEYCVRVLAEKIRRSVPPEDNGGFLLTSCRLALLEIQADAVSEVISFNSDKKVLSFRPSYDEHLQSREDQLIKHILVKLDSKRESERAGYLRVLAAAPTELYSGRIDKVLEAIRSCSQATAPTRIWCCARRNALLALVKIIANLGVDHPELTSEHLLGIYHILLKGFLDYTVDARGDIGSLVREVTMTCLFDLTCLLLPSCHATVLSPALMEEMVVSVCQQAVEKIDRTRNVAGKVFYDILHYVPQIPNIPHRERLIEIFPKSECEVLNWMSAEVTFNYFVQLLDIPEFSYSLMLGLLVSVGGLTEKTARCSSESLRNQLRKHEGDLEYMKNFIRTIDHIFSNQDGERVALPLLKFTDFILNEPAVTFTLLNEDDLLLSLLNSSWDSIKRSVDVHRIKAAIDIFGAMLQFEGVVRSRSVTLMMVTLGHRFPVVRKNTASKLYECMLIYPFAKDEVSDELVNILTETIWENDRKEIKLVRNRICELLDLPVPKPMNSGPLSADSEASGLTSCCSTPSVASK